MDELIPLERSGWEALASDPDRARRFYGEVLAQQVLMVLPGGLVLSERATALEAMSGAPWTWFELEDASTFALAADVALVTYRATAEREGQPTYTALCTSTYVRDDDSWKLSVHQQTPV